LCWTATGKPLTKVEDIAVKPGSIPAKICPTQPLSVGMPQIGTRPDRSRYVGRHAVDQLMCRIKFKSMRYEGLFTAPDTDVSLSFPGSLGGMNWGGLSADPTNQLIFVNDMRLGLWVQMMPQKKEAKLSDGGEAPNTGMGQVPLGGTPYAVIKDRFMSPLGIPCQKPPFGTLTAIDMKTQQVVWCPWARCRTPVPWASRCACPCLWACPHWAARWRPRAAWCSLPARRTTTCAPGIAPPARKSGRAACPWAARAAP
jgi:glucose dehydrogenase